MRIILFSVAAGLASLGFGYTTTGDAAPAPPPVTDLPRHGGSASVLDLDGYVAVPFRVEESCHTLWVKGVVGGKELKLIVDTGAVNTWLNLDTAKRIGMALESSGSAAGWLRDGVPYYYARMPKLSLGKYSCPAKSVVVCDLSKMFDLQAREREGLKFDGIIGADILTSHSAIIDYRSQTLYLRDPQDRTRAPHPRPERKAEVPRAAELPPIRLLRWLFPNAAGPHVIDDWSYTLNGDLSLTAELREPKTRLTFRLDGSITIGDGSGIDIILSPSTGSR